ncbi:MAG: PorT family protein [Rikenellaceae bacterium]|jgi:hypothetical protein|nr:PorT family protein [Rikenellaceae bacterium]
MKNLFSFAAALAMTLTASAQNGPMFGVKAGLNLATMTNDSEARIKPGFYVAWSMECRINSWSGLEAALGYSLQGCKVKVEDTNLAINLNYINLPLVFKVYPVENLSICAGSQFGFLAASRVKMSSGQTTTSVDFGSECYAFDLSVPFGIAYKLNKNFEIGTRYVIGISYVLNAESTQNRVVQIGVGYIF